MSTPSPTGSPTPTRCPWLSDDPLYVRYHDEEWGVPVHDDRRLFEKLTLEGAQAGLSWLTILKRREGYRRRFHEFDLERIAAWTAADVDAALRDEGIIRNRAKVEATVQNARACLDHFPDPGGLSAFLWSFVDGATIHNRFRRLDDFPASTDRSKAMSKALKERGFTFVGPTICYAFMQSMGMVNDHTVDCFRYAELGGG